MAYFQDLPLDYQTEIISCLMLDKEIIGDAETEQEKEETVYDWINRNNDESTIKELVNEHCL